MINHPLFFVLLIVTFIFSVSCKNTKPTFTEETVDDLQTDPYALLTKPAVLPQKAEEDLSGRLIVIDENDFIERITAIDNPKGFQYLGKTPCIVLFGAGWCRYCTAINQFMLEMAPEYKGKVIFYRLDLDRALHVGDAFQVEHLPRIIYFDAIGKMYSTEGYLNKEQLRNKIEQLLHP